MQKIILFVFSVLLSIPVCFISVHSQALPPARPSAGQMKQLNALKTLVDKAANDTIKKYEAKGFKAENLAITLVDMRDPMWLAADFNGEQKIYPASVGKLFYLVAGHQWLKDGKLTDTPELRRAVKHMIVDSSNDATQFIVDTLTETSGGPELSEKELKEWVHKRNAVNRYFSSLGF